MLDEVRATAWLHAGDAMHGPAAVEAEDAVNPLRDPLRAPVARWFKERPIPVYIVKGNHDIADDFGAFRHGSEVSGVVRQIAPKLYVAGVGWCGEKYFELPLESDLESMCAQVIRQATRLVRNSYHLVLLTHYPPRLPGMREMERNPRNGGLWYDCVRELAATLRPAAIIQGHAHGWSGTSQSVDLGGKSVVIFHPGRIGGTLLLEMETGAVEVEWPAIS
jgi:Icc-related predicted phosphoesterase